MDEMPEMTIEVAPSTLAVVEAVGTTGGWHRARKWLQMATHFECRRLVAQVMAGFEVLALHDQLQVRMGMRRPLEYQNEILAFRQLMENGLASKRRTVGPESLD
jgi:hypothetical protein